MHNWKQAKYTLGWMQQNRMTQLSKYVDKLILHKLVDLELFNQYAQLKAS